MNEAAVATSIDWTAISLFVLSGVGTLATVVGGFFWRRLDRHMEKVEGFMESVGKREIRVDMRLDGHDNDIVDLRRRVRDKRRLEDIHGKVTEVLERLPGDERRTA